MCYDLTYKCRLLQGVINFHFFFLWKIGQLCGPKTFSTSRQQKTRIRKWLRFTPGHVGKNNSVVMLKRSFFHSHPWIDFINLFASGIFPVKFTSHFSWISRLSWMNFSWQSPLEVLVHIWISPGAKRLIVLSSKI